MKIRNKSRQSGFTLVEIAIVLVIIGLLLGGVLKGQEMIEQSKISRVVNDFNVIGAAFNSYQGRYKALPGDDPNAAVRWTTAIGGGAATAGDGSNTITTTLANVFLGGVGNEGGLVWQHLRAAGLLSGNLSSAVLSSTPQTTPFNSNYGFSGSVSAMGLGVVPTFCASLPAKAAEQLDRQLDDGVPGTGIIRANVPSAAMNTVPAGAAVAVTVVGYVDSAATPWTTVCKKI